MVLLSIVFRPCGLGMLPPLPARLPAVIVPCVVKLGGHTTAEQQASTAGAAIRITPSVATRCVGDQQIIPSGLFILPARNSASAP